MFPVPNGLAPDIAVLTEPMAIARHAVNRSEITKRDAAVVLGCGPVGLAVICMLKAHGVDTIVASDPSPGRRALATTCGAHIVVNAGVGMEPDRFRPAMAINKEIDVRFVVGYGPLEFHNTLHLLADGKVDGTALVTGSVGLAGVATAFEALARPDEHAKIIIDP